MTRREMLGLGAAAVAALRVDAQTGWNVVWADEFNAAANTPPDPSKWGYDTGGGGWGNKELEVYTTDIQNCCHDGEGNLVIQALETSPGKYTSARLLTRGKFAAKYGKIEARIKVPFGQGLWPAFWVLGDDIKTLGWPACGEIDIMENLGREPNMVHGTLHGPGYSGGNALTSSYSLASGERLADAFHVYGVEWGPDAVRFLLDDKVYSSETPAQLPQGAKWVFTHPFFILLNVAVGGAWPGNPDKTTTFPQKMWIDYVRVSQSSSSVRES